MTFLNLTFSVLLNPSYSKANNYSSGKVTLRLFISLCLFVVAFSSSSANKVVVSLYTYHLKPPFIVNEAAKSGLYYDLATFLNQQTQTYEFQTVYIPRKRIDRLLQQNKLKGVVVGVSPSWFKDKEETRYHWFDSFYYDRDEFVSLKSNKFEYTDYQSLSNITIAGVAGYYYHGVNEAVSGFNAKRINTIGETQVLTLIEKGRADTGIVSNSVFKYLKAQQQLPDIYYLSEKAHDAFGRRAFLSYDNQELQNKLNKIFKDLANNKDWQSIISQYE